MAFTGDAVTEAEAVIKKSRRRISDYLGDSDGDGHEVTAPPPPPETPPRLRLPRFTCARLRFGRLGRKKRRGVAGGRKEVAAAAGEKRQYQDVSVDFSGRRQPAETSSGASAEAGMGLSMLLLLARTCVELNRMAEVRAQMEALLEEIREEAGKMKSADHVLTVRARPTCSLQPSSSTTTASSSCTSDTHTNCHAATSSGPAVARGEGDKSTPSEDEEGRARIAAPELEEDELETEHARRQPLEWKCSTEEDTYASSSDDEFIELEGVRFTGGDLGRDAVDNDDGGGGGSEYEEDETRGAWDGGVSAVELERRLHELQHQRDRERIEELEAALRRAELKLKEKEMEARLWQDTAALALRPPPPPRDGQ